MKMPQSYPRRRAAIARATVKALPSPSMIVGLYFMSIGILALTVALHRT